MKTKYLTVIASAFLALAASSTAAVMNITVNAAGSYLQNGALPGDPANSLASKAFYGSFNSGDQNNNQSTNFNFLKGVVANWNANSLSPILPALPSSNPGASPVDNGSIGGGSSFTTAAGYDYVVFHFGNGQAGAGGGPSNDDENGWWAAWYLGGESASFSAVPQEGSPLQNVGGFSSARYFNGRPTTRVPDGGSTFIAFGIGLLGLGCVRRLLKA
jgi:hypothetical protein